MKKKILLLLLTITIIITIVGCGNENSSTPTPTPTPTLDKLEIISYKVNKTDNPYMQDTVYFVIKNNTNNKYEWIGIYTYDIYGILEDTTEIKFAMFAEIIANTQVEINGTSSETDASIYVSYKIKWNK